jgi:hypothetical protein
VTQLRTQLAWHCEWLSRLYSFGCPRWKLVAVMQEVDELAQAVEWEAFERSNVG